TTDAATCDPGTMPPSASVHEPAGRSSTRREPKRRTIEPVLNVATAVSPPVHCARALTLSNPHSTPTDSRARTRADTTARAARRSLPTGRALSLMTYPAEADERAAGQQRDRGDEKQGRHRAA